MAEPHPFREVGPRCVDRGPGPASEFSHPRHRACARRRCRPDLCLARRTRPESVEEPGRLWQAYAGAECVGATTLTVDPRPLATWEDARHGSHVATRRAPPAPRPIRAAASPRPCPSAGSPPPRRRHRRVTPLSAAHRRRGSPPRPDSAPPPRTGPDACRRRCAGDRVRRRPPVPMASAAGRDRSGRRSR